MPVRPHGGVGTAEEAVARNSLQLHRTSRSRQKLSTWRNQGGGSIIKIDIWSLFPVPGTELIKP